MAGEPKGSEEANAEQKYASQIDHGGFRREPEMLAGDNSEYEKALIVFEKMLAFEMDHLQRSNIQRRIGDNCLEIIKQKNDLKICEHAIDA